MLLQSICDVYHCFTFNCPSLIFFYNSVWFCHLFIFSVVITIVLFYSPCYVASVTTELPKQQNMWYAPSVAVIFTVCIFLVLIQMTIFIMATQPRTDWISFNYITELRFGWYHPIPHAGAADTQPQWLLMNDISLTLQTPFLVVFGSIPRTRAGDRRGVARNLWCGQFLLCRASRL